jgi:hypothetical protein
VAARAEDPERALAAASMIHERDVASARIRRLGVEVALAEPRALPLRALQAYLRAKSRLRL